MAILVEQQVYSNHYWLLTLLLALIAFTPADRRLSLIGTRTDDDHAPSAAAMLMLTQLTVCYAFGALSKMNPWWIAGDELRNALRLELAGWMYALLAVAVVVTELFIAVGFGSGRPWSRPWRLAWHST